MESLAKGQLSYMILSCLNERDMYGLELIDEIKGRYGYEVKLPSLYSNINRMKELKFISSYLKESTKGPKCSYSSITELGREELEKLKVEFAGLKAAPKPQSSLQNDFERIIASIKSEQAEKPEPVLKQPEESMPEQESDDYFDYFSINDDEPAASTQNQAEEPAQVNIVQNQTEQEQEQPASIVNAVNKPVTEEESDYNQRVYAAAKDFSRSRNRRSYSENQISLALSSAPARSEEEKQQDLTELKQALLNSKQSYVEKINLTAEQSQTEKQVVDEFEQINEEKPKEEAINEKQDDGRFITERYAENEIPKAKKIEPARLNVLVPSYDKTLPAPKRNIAVDPTVSDVKAKLESLYAKAEVKKEEPAKPEIRDYETYEDLKRYFKSQEVEFKVYERPARRPKHNTNLLKLYVSLFIFGLIGVGSAIMYLIFSLSGLTKAETNFVYYLFPIIALVYVVYCYYNNRTMVSKVPSPLWHPAIVWSIFALMIVAIFMINYACGVPFDEAATYFSTILVPIFAAACSTVGIYYATLFSYKRFWK